MSIFKYLFGNKGKTEATETAVAEPGTVVEPQTDTVPPIDLFIDNEAPQPKQTIEQPQSRVTVFLSRNYHSIGIHDGYEYHSQETLETAKKKIRAEFQLIIDQAIQEKLASRLQLKNLMMQGRNSKILLRNWNHHWPYCNLKRNCQQKTKVGL